MAGLSAFVALLVVAVVWVALDDEPYVAPPPPTTAPGVRPAAAAAVLADLGTAVEDGDRAAALELAADDDRARAALADLARAGRTIRFATFDLRYVDELGGADDEGTWPASALLTWQYAGYDASPAAAEVRVDLTAVGDEVAVAGLGGDLVVPVWWGTPVSVTRTADTLVVTADDGVDYARLARRAVTVVRRVVPGWRESLVVEVPATAAALDRALDVDRGSFAGVAGVTATADGSGDDDAPVHVFLNPEQMGDLRPAGAQVVVSHEAAHVALDATSTTLPVWLSEGFADYVALRDVELPLTTTAAQVARQVRRDGLPRRLPDDRDFDGGSDYFGAAYEAAWLACRLLVRREGEDAVLRFYRAADGSDDVEALFEDSFGLTVAAFTREWRSTLADLAG